MKIFISLALLLILITLTYMKSWHHVFFKYSAQSILSDFWNENKESQVIHILGGECGCSEVIAEYLIKRKERSDISEKVLIIDNFKEYAEALEKAGFETEYKKLSDFQNQIDISGVPFFIVHNDKKEILYIGGYTDESITPDTPKKDLEIISATLAGRQPASLRVFGCAKSKAYQTIIDPLGLKYKKM